MADGPGLNLAFSRAPDFSAQYANAFDLGRQGTAPANATPNAFNGSAGEPSGETSAINLAALSPAQRAQAARQAELMGAIGVGLAGAPYAERRAILTHMTPALTARGVDPAQISDFDPTDANIGRAVADARLLADRLAPPAG